MITCYRYHRLSLAPLTARHPSRPLELGVGRGLDLRGWFFGVLDAHDCLIAPASMKCRLRQLPQPGCAPRSGPLGCGLAKAIAAGGLPHAVAACNGSAFRPSMGPAWVTFSRPSPNYSSSTAPCCGAERLWLIVASGTVCECGGIKKQILKPERSS